MILVVLSRLSRKKKNLKFCLPVIDLLKNVAYERFYLILKMETLLKEKIQRLRAGFEIRAFRLLFYSTQHTLYYNKNATI